MKIWSSAEQQINNRGSNLKAGR